MPVRRLLLASLAALTLAGVAHADDRQLLDARARYLPAALATYPATADGLQARYDAGRDLVEAVRAAGRYSLGCNALRSQLLAVGSAQVLNAEAGDRPVATGTVPVPRVVASCESATAGVVPPLPPPLGSPFWPADQRAALPRARDAALERRLAAAAARFSGTAGVFVHDLRSGRTGGLNADVRFPAASTVKLAVLVAALAGRRHPERSPFAYDAERIGAWSSNLAANRIVTTLGLRAVADGFRRLGMTSSTYPGLYRAGTSARPPGWHTRVTTPRDLARALFRLHAAALGRGWALRATGLTRGQANTGRTILLGAQPLGDNAGLLRRWLHGARLAQKSGWISDTRMTAAIVYRSTGPVIVVVAGYRPGVTLNEAQRLGRDVIAAAGLR